MAITVLGLAVAILGCYVTCGRRRHPQHPPSSRLALGYFVGLLLTGIDRIDVQLRGSLQTRLANKTLSEKNSAIENASAPPAAYSAATILALPTLVWILGCCLAAGLYYGQLVVAARSKCSNQDIVAVSMADPMVEEDDNDEEGLEYCTVTTTTRPHYHSSQ